MNLKDRQIEALKKSIKLWTKIAEEPTQDKEYILDKYNVKLFNQLKILFYREIFNTTEKIRNGCPLCEEFIDIIDESCTDCPLLLLNELDYETDIICETKFSKYNTYMLYWSTFGHIQDRAIEFLNELKMILNKIKEENHD